MWNSTNEAGSPIWVLIPNIRSANAALEGSWAEVFLQMFEGKQGWKDVLSAFTFHLNHPQPSSAFQIHSVFCRKPFLGSPHILRVSGPFRRANQQLQLPIHLPGHVRVPRHKPQRHPVAAGHGHLLRTVRGGAPATGAQLMGGGMAKASGSREEGRADRSK